MNTKHVKQYAPRARTEFIAAVSKQAAKYGISADNVETAEHKGDVVLIGGRPFPAVVIKPRERLIERIRQQGFDQVMESIAYSWFNRLCAIRYLELKGFLDHGRRVLSHPKSDTGFQMLEECLDIDMPGLNQAKIRELKLDGTKDEALYRELLLAQCRALHDAMPFLFEAVLDESELLLPENLTKTDSLIYDLVASIPEQDWEHIEIIGWLYQFYISEKKDQVIGKVVKSEDIPAATQLFTPDWIVKYLVQNSVGRQWLQTYPNSPLKAGMEYYITPAEQTPEVQAQLAEITPAQLDPETIKVLDPACGSGHILVEAYKVLKAIYEERGYRRRDIPKKILEKNLFGLDIDDRAGQLAAFALMMLAREDDRRIFSRPPVLNIQSLTAGEGIDVAGQLPAIGQVLKLGSQEQEGLGLSIRDLLDCFKPAKTLGSLITIPERLSTALPTLQNCIEQLATCGDTFMETLAADLQPLIQQAMILDQKYDAVIANPPYMGSKYQTAEVKKALKSQFKGYEKDLFSAFIIRNLQFAKERGQLGFMTPFVWMFISSYEQLRSKLIDDEVISTLIQLEYSGFDGATVPICTFTLTKGHVPDYTGSYIRLSDFKGATNQAPKTLEAIANKECGWFYEAKPDDFKKIPGSPVAYWVSEKQLRIFGKLPSNGQKVKARQGMATADNNRFLRYWPEVSIQTVLFDCSDHSESLESNCKWFPYNKGGEYRKWYGNQDFLVNWESGGKELHDFKPRSVIRNPSYYFKPSVSWSDVTSSTNAFRFYPKGFIFDGGSAHSAFCEDETTLFALMAMCNNNFSTELIKAINPTMHFHIGYFEILPYPENLSADLAAISKEAVSISKKDWDLRETSWNFTNNPVVFSKQKRKYIEDSVNEVIKENQSDRKRLRSIEYKSNELFIQKYGLAEEVASEVDDSQITLLNLNHDNLIIDLISYSIGCQMGRYSLDREGLVYAHAGNEGFKELQKEGAYHTFPADDDGIIPLTAQEWFSDDATNRFLEFVEVVWGKEHLKENLDFVAESLCLHAIKPKKGEGALETIRRYLSTQFFKDHLKTYKKRPIYWLFSSGKQKAFECLVYLHRYNEGTLARMRTEYVTPLLSKMASYEQKLENDKDASESAAEIKRLEKEIEKLHKQQAELSTFDEKLRHYADQRIHLDLDDGVKVNYAKFGDLLAEVKAVTGRKPK